MPKLSIHLFGFPQIYLDDSLLKVERRKTLALLAYVAANGTTSRDVLGGLLWPECSQDQAGGYLRQTLWDFNKAAGEGWIERSGPALGLCKSADLSVDVNTFEACLTAWKSEARQMAGEQDPARVIGLLEEAVRLYTADFLAGFTVHDCPEFDDWQVLQSEGLRLKLAEALERLSRLYGAQGTYEPAIVHARRWLSLDELNEAAHRELMRLYDESGQRSAAMRQFEACQRRLQDELGVTPEPATVELFQQISRARKSSQNGALAQAQERSLPPAKPKMVGPVPIFLPGQTTTFFGRDAELSQIKHMLGSSECRLITLVGPGGTGKTRLAIEAASQSSGYPHELTFPHGIFFAGLASATHAVEALHEMAAAVKLEYRTAAAGYLSPEEAKNQLLQYLSGRMVLLVVDNLEQITSCAELFSEMLAAAPGLKLIATSRIRLNLSEEWVLEVPGLPYPAEEDPQDIESYAAVQMFLRMAERTGRYTRSEDDYPAIARICRLVAGLPLGIEMAAAWVKILSCAEIADEIARNLDFLESTRPGITARQRSLRGVFEHSWQLLAENERAVFRRLSIFQGGFTRETAFQVAGASLHLLSALTDQSLLKRVTSGRFDLHELVKQYAAEKLAEQPEEQAETELRHAAYFAGWMRQKGSLLRGRDQIAALSALRGELLNLRKAWSWLVENVQTDLLQMILPDVILFCEMSGEHSVGRECMRQIVEMLRRQPEGTLPAEVKPNLLSLGLAGLRHFNRAFEPWETGNPLQVETVSLTRQLPAGYLKAFCYILTVTGPGILEISESIRMSKEAVTIFQGAGDVWGCGLAHVTLGDALGFSRKDPQGSRAAYEQGLAYFQQAGDSFGRALCLYGLAWVARLQGNQNEAHQWAAESLEIYLHLGNIGRIFDVRNVLAEIDELMGDVQEARLMLNANLAVLVNAGEKHLRKTIEERLEKLTLAA